MRREKVSEERVKGLLINIFWVFHFFEFIYNCQFVMLFSFTGHEHEKQEKHPIF